MHTPNKKFVHTSVDDLRCAWLLRRHWDFYAISGMLMLCLSAFMSGYLIVRVVQWVLR